MRLSGSTTLSLPAPGVRLRAVAITAAGSLSWNREGSLGARNGQMDDHGHVDGHVDGYFREMFSALYQYLLLFR